MAGIKVALFGQKRWCEHLMELINGHPGTDVTLRFVPLSQLMYPRNIAFVRDADILLRVGFRPGACTVRGWGFDVVWRIVRSIAGSASVIYYWIGTDVWNALREHRSGRRSRRLQNASRDVHFAGAPYFVDELHELGIPAWSVLFPTDLPEVPPVTALPRQFRVLSYIPDQRHEFYGGGCIYECARRLPYVQFDIVAGQGTWVSEPLPNLHFQGWQTNMAPWFLNCCAVLRLVMHDAVGAMVREALAFGRHVVYTYPLPFTVQVPFGDVNATEMVIARLYQQWQLGMLNPNSAGSQYAHAQFNSRTSVNSLICAMHRATAGQHALK